MPLPSLLGALPSTPTPGNRGAAALLGCELGAYAAGSEVVVVDVSFKIKRWD
jgi:hypothetical protein